MRKIAACILFLGAGLLVSGVVRAQTDPQESRIMALENAWSQAESRGDTKAIEQLLSLKFVYVDESGNLLDRGGYLATLKGTSFAPVQTGNREMIVHMYGSIAIVAGVYHERGTKNGKAYELSGRFTDTWVNQNGIWQCVASALTPRKNNR
ncbi:MAG: nuclear transport factor 2 family protein [Acidobacteriia bacterium]|nr:nuclear transport factor 2 family protein [Terriglobia bacterium]